MQQNEDLQSLELVHKGIPFPLTKSFAKEFSKASKLNYLKFINFQVRRDGSCYGCCLYTGVFYTFMKYDIVF